MTVVLLLNWDDDDWILWFEGCWIFILSWMAPINLLSMRHILKSVKALKTHGIYENWLIMRLYGLFWITGFCTMVIDLVLLIYARDTSLPFDEHKRYQIAFDAMSLINFAFLFGLDALILITFIRFSLKLSPSTLKRLTHTL